MQNLITLFQADYAMTSSLPPESSKAALKHKQAAEKSLNNVIVVLSSKKHKLITINTASTCNAIY